MFEVGAIYWFKIMSSGKEVSIRGKVKSEEDYLVLIERDNGNEEIIGKKNIMYVNKAQVQGITNE